MFENKEEFKSEFSKRIIESYGSTVHDAHITEEFMVLESMVRDFASIHWQTSKYLTRVEEKKQMHYFSMEFMMGRMLVNNMLNLGIYDIVKDGLADFNIDIHALEELETDAGLGNGGLGRLAACFLDSLTTLKYPCQGHSIRYVFGLFKQKIEDGYQIELPDQWMKLGFMWEVRKPKHRVAVKFFGKSIYNGETGKYEHIDYEEVYAIPYDVPIIGRDTKVVNTLRLWSAEASDNISGCQDFRQYIQDVRDICQMLYPDDSTYAGKTLRLKQEYFFTAAGIRSIMDIHMKQYKTFNNFHEKNVIQLNDTHPVLAIPEMMRILLDDFDYQWEDAWDIVSQTFAYTNHTILRETLETWPNELMQTVLPRVYQIIDEMHRRFVSFVKIVSNHDEDFIRRTCTVDDGYVHMAYMAINACFSINGVAKLHTKILEQRELKDFAFLYPNKFNNKTNGVSHRRWLAYCNSDLADLISRYIGKDWLCQPSHLEKLMLYVDNPHVQEEFLQAKRLDKIELAKYIKDTQGLEVSVDSIFDVQVKRFHAYKRQLLNILHIMYLYLEMKQDPSYRIYPHTFIFGGKAASSYYFAKKIIKLINSVANTVNNDPETSDYLKVVFLENYGVSIAERCIPAADVSEQISTAGKEASGTGNMKFMMNGAITLGTMDGANVEIVEHVGEKNAVIFGLVDDEIRAVQEEGTYNAWTIYHNNHKLKRVVDSLLDGTFDDNKEEFRMIFEELMNHNDEYFVFADFEEYIDAHKKVERLYKDRSYWAKICLTNIAKSGYFSSDRTVEEYVHDIWKIEPLDF
ncbi:MAG: glycogen/starch/alpha-glucan phosphorylase [Coprobacillaceae bacterium]